MKKYIEYLEKKADKWSAIIAILCALIVFVAIAVDMSTPVDTGEIEHHYSQLEMIKQDSANLCKLENADITIREDGMTVTLKGKQHHLQAFFDENGNYENATIVDNRVGSNIFISIIIVVAGLGIGSLISYILLILLFIPVWVYRFIIYLKKNWKAKKQKQKQK